MPGAVMLTSRVRPDTGSLTTAAGRSPRTVDDEVVVVTAAIADLGIAGVADTVAHPVGAAEVERGAGHGAALAGGIRVVSTGVNVLA